MKLTDDFNPIVRNSETPKPMVLETANGDRLEFMVRGLMCQDFRKANDKKYKNEEQKGIALLKALIFKLPDDMELKDGTPATLDNLDKLFTDFPWLINTIIDFSKEHPQFDPKA